MRLLVCLAVSTTLIHAAGAAALDVTQPESQLTIADPDLQPRRLEERLADLARREEAVAERSWEAVFAEVEEQARTLGVGAPAGELPDCFSNMPGSSSQPSTVSSVSGTQQIVSVRGWSVPRWKPSSQLSPECRPRSFAVAASTAIWRLWPNH